MIDDNASCRSGLKDLFESVGLKVKLYESGSAFLEDRIPDATSCLVIDVRLPAKSGLKVQEELAEADVHVPIIFITGHGDIPMAVGAMKAGAVDFLTSPSVARTFLMRFSRPWNRMGSAAQRKKYTQLCGSTLSR